MHSVSFLSSTLVEFDRKADYIPILSNATNIVALFLKCVFRFIPSERIPTHHYFRHIQDKSTMRCLILAFIPLFNVVCIALFDYIQHQQAERLLIEGLDYLKKGQETDKLMGFQLILEAALKENPDAMQELAFCYEKGIGTKQNNDNAFFWYRKAADRGNIESINSIGDCYSNVIGVPINYNKAFSWYEAAADQGLTLAMCHLADCYFNARGVKENLERVYYWIEKAARKDDTEAMFRLGQLYFKGIYIEQSHEEAVHWFSKATLRKHHEAMTAFGECYLRGYGIKGKKIEEAVKLFLEATNDDVNGKADPKAYYWLGCCKEEGHAFEILKSYPSALHYYTQSKEMGCPDAMYKLGKHYSDGTLVPAWDRFAAADLFKQGAEKGHLESMYEYARCLEKGEGVPLNPKEAFNWYKKGADKMHAKAVCSLARLYENGIGTEKNKSEAFKYYQLAAGQEDPEEAMLGLAKCYKERGTPEDLKTSFEWLEKAAKKLSAAKHQIGLYYLQGIYKARDLSEAEKVFEEDLENKDSLFELGKLNNGHYPERPFNKEKAIKNFIDAQDLGHIEASYELGILHQDQPALALDFFKIAAKRKHSPSIYKVGLHFLNCTPHLYIEALYWFKQGEALNNFDCTCELGKITQKIEPKNPLKAIEYYRKGAHVHPESQYRLGLILMQDPKKQEEGIKLLKLAAESNFTEAMYELAVCYQKGIVKDEEKDPQKVAADLLLKAAEMNHAPSIYQLGLCYLNGTGVSKNEFNAFKQFKRAHDLNDPAASFKLWECYNTGTGCIKNPIEATMAFNKAFDLDYPEAIFIKAEQLEAAKQFARAYTTYSKAACK